MNGQLDPERLTAWLRVVAVPVLLVGEEFIAKPEPTEAEFLVVLGLFAAYAIATLAGTHRLSERGQIALLAVDVAFAGGLSYTSGGGYSQLRLVFLFPIVIAAFRYRPALTAAVACSAIVVYVAQALPHPSVRSRSDSWSFIAVQVAYLVWLGAALSLMSLLLARREQAIRALSGQRRRLVVELLTTEERERKRLAEDLHDHSIQNLLVARHELHEDAVADPNGPAARAQAAIADTVDRLRDTISDMHPHLLDHVGLDAAIEQAAMRSSARACYRVELDLARAVPAPNDRVLLRAVTELLANVERHAGASQVTVSLRRVGEFDELRVEDDGVGFDPHAEPSIRSGHIGLLSLSERVESLGGSVRIETAPGNGTSTLVRLPRAEAPARRQAEPGIPLPRPSSPLGRT
jgi:two-component system NarL family sensor kinase